MKRDELTRRQFLKTAKKWSKVVIAGAIAGAAVVLPGGWAAVSCINRRGRGGGGWVNRGGGGWINRRGGGGWINRR
jgi:hypothetical protein